MDKPACVPVTQNFPGILVKVDGKVPFIRPCGERLQTADALVVHNHDLLIHF